MQKPAANEGGAVPGCNDVADDVATDTGGEEGEGDPSQARPAIASMSPPARRIMLGGGSRPPPVSRRETRRKTPKPGGRSAKPASPEAMIQETLTTPLLQLAREKIARLEAENQRLRERCAQLEALVDISAQAASGGAAPCPEAPDLPVSSTALSALPHDVVVRVLCHLDVRSALPLGVYVHGACIRASEARGCKRVLAGRIHCMCLA